MHRHRHQRDRRRTSVAGLRFGSRRGTPAAAPQPSALATSGQIVVTFSAPANNGSAITGYTAICTDGVSPATNSITGAAAAPITITGLTNGHSYTCTVTASNAIGAGLPSPASAAVAVGAPAAPGVTSVVASNGQIVVTFTAPADNGNAITGYGATCTDGVTPASAVLAGAAAAPITVTGLTNGHSYTCTVTATNGNGAGPASVASAAAVPTAGVPAQPAPPTITTGNAQILVSYTAPADNGSPITFYSATCTSADGGTSGLTSITGPTATPITVGGLTNGHTYTCVVSAINVVGSSPSSAPSASAFVGLPGAPPQPTIAAGNAQIVVTFAAPNDNGSTITGYTATCTSGNGGVTGSKTGTASPLIVTALTNGASYTCTVAAANVFGPGPSSPASAAAVPSLVPASPAAPTVLFGNERITVTFTPIVDVANPVTGYAATCTSLDGGTPGAKSGTTSPLVVTSLTNGKTYSCTVSATNIVGTSPPSPPSAGVVPAAAPAAPTLVGVTAGNAALTVSFSPNSNNGSAIIAFTATCTSANGGITGAASGPTSPLTVSQLNNGNIYVCKVSATNAVGASVPSATSQAFIVGQPAAPSILPVVSGPAPGLTGSLKVSFHPGAANAGAIMQYRATCIPVGSGVTRSNVGSGSPIIVSNVLSGHAYSCSVTETNFIGTSDHSGSKSATVGTPAPPNVLKVLKLGHGIALPFSPPASNGHPITNYRARCTSSNGGVPSSPLQFRSPIVINKLSLGKTYVCLVTAINVRGESPPRTVGPVVITAPTAANLAVCSGNAGNVQVSPGLLLAVRKPHTFSFGATLGSCSGPYVRAARISVSFHSKSAMSCETAIGAPSGGSGTVTWTSPVGLGTSAASIQLVFDGTQGHTTLAHFSGLITTRSNVFSDAHVSGTLVLHRGLDAATSGGDCSTASHLGGFSVTSAHMTIS